MNADQSWNVLYEKVGRGGDRESNEIVLILGAGVSSALFPTWQQLVQLIAGSPEVNLNSGTLSDLFAQGWSYPRILGLLRRLFKDKCTAPRIGDEFEFAWADLVRQHLYARVRQKLGIEPHQFPDLGEANKKEKDVGFAKQIEERNPTIASIVDLCVATRNGAPVPRPRVSAVLTYNIDALLQNYDRALHGSPRMFRTIERASKRRHPRKVPLYHLHGLIQPARTSEASETAKTLVLCEDEYNARTDDPYSFANTTMQWALRDFLCVFIGCSLNDELMRRALYRAKQEQRNARFAGARNPEDEEPRHFAVTQYDVHHELREKDSRLLEVGPLWVADFGHELSERLAGLRDVLDS